MNAAEQPTHRASPHAPGQPISILVVDDDNDARLLLSTMLSGEGYLVKSAASAEEALELARAEPPDLVISDVLLPNMDGFALIRTMKADPQLAAIPFVFYTATFIDPADRRTAMEFGASRYIIKPTSTDAFLASIREVMEEMHGPGLPAPKPTQLGEAELAALHEETLLRKLRRKVDELERDRSALRYSEARYRQLVQDAPDPILLFDRAGVIHFVNSAGAELLPFEVPDRLGSLLERVIASDRNRVRNAITRAWREQQPLRQLQFGIRDRAGQERILEANGSFLADDSTQLVQVILHDVTEQLHSQQALQQASAVVAESPAVLFRWGPEPEWPVRYVSPNISYFGFDPQLFAGGDLSYRDLIHPADRERVAKELAACATRDMPCSRREYRLIGPDQRLFWVDDRTTIERDADGKVRLYQGIVIDITVRKQAELRLAHRLEIERLVGVLSARFAAVSPERVSAAIDVSLDEIGRFLGAERAYLVRFNDSGDELTVEHEWLHARSAPPGRRRRPLKTSRLPWLMGQLRNLQPVYVIKPDALPAAARAERALFRRRRIGVFLAVPVASEGRLLGSVCFEQGPIGEPWDDEDIRLLPPVADAMGGAIARAASRQALIDSEGRYRQLVDNAPLAIGVLGGDGKLRFANAALRRLFGGSDRAVLLDRAMPDFLAIADQAPFRDALSDVISKGTHVRNREFRFRGLDGRRGWMECSLAAVSFGGETAVQLLARDISQRRRTEEALRMANMVVENSTVIAYRVRDDGAVEYLSSNVDRLGFRPAEFLSGRLPFSELIHPDDREPAAAITRDRLAAGDHQFQREYRVLARDGTVRWVDDRTTVIRETDGKVIHLQGVITDVTEHKEAEKHLERLNRSLHTLSQSNAWLVHARDERALLRGVCRTLVETGGYPLAWVIYHHDGQSERPASCGSDSDFLDAWMQLYKRFPAADEDPARIAIRSGESYLEQRLPEYQGRSPWIGLAAESGYGSLVALPLRLEEQTFGALCILSTEVDAFDLTEMRLLLELADDVAFGVTSLRAGSERIELEKARRRSAEQLQRNLVDTIQAMALALEKRDPYTAGHQFRVAQLAAAIATKLGLSQDRIEGIRLGAMIHDIGKIAVPAEILNRPGHLAVLERQIIGEHPSAGHDIVKGVTFPWPLAEMVYQHHERLDGSGYPQGLRGDQIILEARILAVADVVEAMASHRPYRPGLGLDQALEEIRSHRGTLYDAQVVDACLQLFEEGFQFEEAPIAFSAWASEARRAEHAPRH